MKTAKAFYATWTENQLPNQAAAVAFYTIFAVAPLLVLIIELVGFIPGVHHSVVRERIFQVVTNDVGPAAATIVRSLVDASFESSQRHSVLMTIVGWVMIAFAASGLLGTIQSSLERIWKTPSPQGGIRGMIVSRGFSFAAILLLAVAVTVWVTASAAVDVWAKTLAPSAAAVGVAGDVAVEWLVVSGCLAVFFKVLPRSHASWKPVLLGAGITGAMLVLGQYGIQWYLARNASGSAYGVASAFAGLALWIFYSAQLFFAGAALTSVLASGPAVNDRTPVRVIADQTSDDRPRASKGVRPTGL